MNTALSDALKEARAVLAGRARLRLFLMPGEVRRLVKQFHTFVALAEDLEDDLHLHVLREHRDRAQHGCVVIRSGYGTLVFGPRRGDISTTT